MFFILHFLCSIIYRFCSNFVKIWAPRSNLALKLAYKILTKIKRISDLPTLIYFGMLVRPKHAALAVLHWSWKNENNFFLQWRHTRNEPRHDKTKKMSVRPAQTQISLGIRPVWSESSVALEKTLATKWVCAQRRLKSAWASAQSDQSNRCPHEKNLGS